MPTAPIIVYDQNMRKVAYLENASSISYETPLNGLWTASFSLPANDPKNAECLPLRFVEIFDGNERMELFRILPTSTRRGNDGETVTYQCEHVLATLLDDVLFQYHQIGGLGVYTADVLQYILSRQTVQRWQLGTVQFARQFEYNWENENLLGALFSVPKPFVEEYQWTWDTTVFPWRLNLVEPSNEVQAYIRYGVNLRGITKEVDPSNLCTRLYCLGYGEGVNQLTIAEVNDGKPYLDADTQSQYGVITRIFVDRRFEDPATLKARGEALLNELKHPRISYSVEAAELYQLTRDPLDKFRVGAVVQVRDQELGIDIKARVVNVRKSDLFGAPGDVQLEIANRPQDIAGSIAELADRQRINEVYAQGATNIDSHNFADNCDPQHPAVLRFYIPAETVRINRVLMSYRTEAFRAYSRAIAAAPSTTSGPSSRETTASGGQTTSGPSSRTTTASGGAQIDTDVGVQIWDISSPYGIPEVMRYQNDHDHGISAGTRLAVVNNQNQIIGSVGWVPSGGHAHGLVNHSHRFDIPNHTHEMDHTHEIAPHTHGMDHTHEIPSHTHDIEHGIFLGPTPTAVSVKVDGNMVPITGTSVTDLDVVPYLAKDEGGKIRRGTWHTIEITPNNLGRIVVNVITQIFVQSRGGGNY